MAKEKIDACVVATRDLVVVIGGVVMADEVLNKGEGYEKTIIPIRFPKKVQEVLLKTMETLNIPEFDGLENLLEDMLIEGYRQFMRNVLDRGMEEGLFVHGENRTKIIDALFERYERTYQEMRRWQRERQKEV